MLKFENLTVTYPSGVQALKNVNLHIKEGEFVVIAGVSGAGKSTLLRCVNRLIEYTGAKLDGHVWFDGEDVVGASSRRVREIRAQVGMIFQEFNLVKRSRVLRNVLAGRIPKAGAWRSLLGMFRPEDKQISLAALDRVGIKDKAYQRADKLSGGQMQRVGIARALAQEPRIILADEPVASLDPITARIVLEHLKQINEESGITTIVNLHDTVLARAFGDRIVGIRNATIIFDEPVEQLEEATFEEAIYGASLSAHERRRPSRSEPS